MGFREEKGGRKSHSNKYFQLDGTPWWSVVRMRSDVVGLHVT